MILWTIQPEEVFNEIQNNGVYRCDIKKSGMEAGLHGAMEGAQDNART